MHWKEYKHGITFRPKEMRLKQQESARREL